jgi:hypothetical protein
LLFVFSLAERKNEQQLNKLSPKTSKWIHLEVLLTFESNI